MTTGPLLQKLKYTQHDESHKPTSALTEREVGKEGVNCSTQAVVSCSFCGLAVIQVY